MKDYYREDGEHMADSWCILYGTEEEAETAKQNLEDGSDKSFFDPEGNEYAGYDAFLYVDQVTL
jgi:hypothetical protein